MCPVGWRIPTIEEWDRLLKFDSKWEEKKIDNRLFVSRLFVSGNDTIFLPAAGYRDGDDGVLLLKDVSGYYWSNTGRYDNEASGLSFDKDTIQTGVQRKKNGFSVHCVEDK